MFSLINKKISFFIVNTFLSWGLVALKKESVQSNIQIPLSGAIMLIESINSE